MILLSLASEEVVHDLEELTFRYSDLVLYARALHQLVEALQTEHHHFVGLRGE